ncbi:MAG TPA: acyl carrier protein [Stellaceae bacterium]|nr:acyl carrier protein [Stellaceae bacterium]
MTEPEIYAALGGIFSDVFLRDDIPLGPELSAMQVPDWDSFKQIEIIIAVETRFGVKFRTREMDGLNNVGDLVRLIAEKS